MLEKWLILLIRGSSKTIQDLDGLKEQGNKDGRKIKDILATALRLGVQNFVKTIFAIR